MAGEKKKKSSVAIWAVAILIGAFWAATEAYAIYFKFQPALGRWHIGPIYLPFHIVGWALQHGAEFPNAIRLAGFVGMFVFLGGAIAISIVQRSIRNRPQPDSKLYGSARFSARTDIVQAGLLGDEGVFVGGWVDPKTRKVNYLRHNGPEHVLAVAPTRSGKTIGLVLPTLWTWKGSVVAPDLKGELAAAASGHREAVLGNTVLIYEPSSSQCKVCWNPLDEIRLGSDNEVGDAQNIASLIVDDKGKGLEDFWDKTTFSVFVGLLLHVVYRHRTGVRYRLFDDKGEAVVDRLTADTVFSVVEEKKVGDGIEWVVTDKTFVVGEPVPQLENGCVKAGKENKLISLYDIEQVPLSADDATDPRFSSKPQIKRRAIMDASPISTSQGDRVGWSTIWYEPHYVEYMGAAPRGSLAEVLELITDTTRPLSELWEEMRSHQHYDAPQKDGVGHDKRTHSVIARAGVEALGWAEELASSVVATARSFLGLYGDPVVRHNTNNSTFMIADLMQGIDPVTLFVVTQPADKDRLAPLVRLLLTMVVRISAPKQEFDDGKVVLTYNHRLLFMIDEFPALGRIRLIEQSLAWVAGFGIKYFLICQDMNQLTADVGGYGANELITAGCQVRCFFAPNLRKTAEFIAGLTGETTRITKNISVQKNQSGFGGGRNSLTTSYNETARSLMTPDEVLTLPPARKDGSRITVAGDMLIHMSGYPIIYGKQILFWENPYFEKASKRRASEAGPLVRVRYWDGKQRARMTLLMAQRAAEIARWIVEEPGKVPVIDGSWYPPASAAPSEGEHALVGTAAPIAPKVRLASRA